jgi:hypothetical protein
VCLGIQLSVYMHPPSPHTSPHPPLPPLPPQVRIGVRKGDCYCSFLTEPHARFRVRNIVGGDVSSSVSQVRPSVRTSLFSLPFLFFWGLGS